MSEKDNLQEADGGKENEVTHVQDPTEENDQPKSTDSPSETTAIDDSSAESGENDEAIEEINSNNADSSEAEAEAETEAETKEPEEKVTEKDYSTMGMEELVDEFEAILKTEKIQHLKKPVEQIRMAFNKQFGALLEQKKAEFLEGGGNTIDFRFDFPLKKRFNVLFKT
ncbi:MAG: hypothetical protein HKO96_07630, partial [Flavobacteriaceae bacterium]|nr:hypothetical protein [Flavobacteriaceae bacterium]